MKKKKKVAKKKRVRRVTDMVPRTGSVSKGLGVGLLVTREKKKAFIRAFAITGIVTYSAEAAGIARNTHYDWMAEDKTYKLAVEDAAEQAADRVEAEILRRAIQGIDKPIFYKGKVVKTIKEYSDLLLIFWAKATRPGKFREQYDMNIKGGLNVKMSVSAIQEALLSVADVTDVKEIES